MGSRSKRHGLASVKHLQPVGNVAKRARGLKLVAAKQPLLAEIAAKLKSKPEVA